MRLDRTVRHGLAIAVAIGSVALAAPAALAASDLGVSAVGPPGVGLDGTKTWSVSAFGNGDPVSATLLVNVPAVLGIVSVTVEPADRQAQCAGIRTVTCQLTSFGGGGTVGITLRLKGLKPGSGSINASIGTLDVTEENLANNQSSVDVKVGGGASKPRCEVLGSKKDRVKCVKALALCDRMARAGASQRAVRACYAKVRKDHGVP